MFDLTERVIGAAIEVHREPGPACSRPRTRIDLIVESSVIVEIRSLERLDPIHSAQVLTYMKLAGYRIGLIINFNVRLLKHGIRRFVLYPSVISVPSVVHCS